MQAHGNDRFVAFAIDTMDMSVTVVAEISEAVLDSRGKPKYSNQSEAEHC